jgi:two-component system, chemotaxis family, chemotaxis protein CheV
MTVSQLLPLTDTAEVEIVEFLLGNNLYGTYVQNVREVINVLPITPVPLTHPCMEGLIKFREEVITVIDLAKCLGYSSGREKRQVQDKYIIAEIKTIKVAFHVQAASRIHRFNRAKIETTNENVQGMRGNSLGVVQMKDQLLILLDLEGIVGRLSG